MVFSFSKRVLDGGGFYNWVLSRIRLRNFAVEKMAEGFGGGDGLAFSGTKLYISDWKGKFGVSI